MIKVYGDIMLDRWILGNAGRISPEAPVPILLEKNQKYSIGGAANMALNLRSLNDGCSMFGCVGQDDEGLELRKMLKESKLDLQISNDQNVTTTKTRLVGQGGQHIMRWDREEKYAGKRAFEKLISSVITGDTIVISDYNKGTVNAETVKELVRRQCTVFVDPKQGPEIYKDAFLVKPNMSEYEAWFGEYNLHSAKQAMKKFGWSWLVVTDGKKGIHVTNSMGGYKHFKEEVKEVADVTGAGDTVLAVIVYGYEKGMDIFDACELACYGAARNVEKRGVAVISKQELHGKIVWTNGVFDILHIGHLKLLRHAHSLGDTLIVGINSDASVKRLKGDLRPINDQETRKQLLLELGFIDEVIIFDEDTPLDIIEDIEPDVIVKGGDYTTETTVGNHLAEVVIFPTVEGHSTSSIIKKIDNDNKV